MNNKKETVEKCLRNYLEKEYNAIAEIKESDNLIGSLGIDSLGILKMAISIEEELGIVIPDEELARIEDLSYGEVVDYFVERY